MVDSMDSVQDNVTREFDYKRLDHFIFWLLSSTDFCLRDGEAAKARLLAWWGGKLKMQSGAAVLRGGHKCVPDF